MTMKTFMRSGIFSLIALFGTLLYTYGYYGEISVRGLQEAFAVAAVIVIAPSLALSGIAYFWNWGDTLVVYRKPLGLQGFFFGLIHVGIAIWINGMATRAFQLESAYDISIVVGYIAVVLFALMPCFSNPIAARKIGGMKVRLALRYLGYAAYILVLWHAYVLFVNKWLVWCQTYDPLMPPPTLVAFVVGILVLLLRIALFIAQQYKKRRPKA